MSEAEYSDDEEETVQAVTKPADRQESDEGMVSRLCTCSSSTLSCLTGTNCLLLYPVEESVGLTEDRDKWRKYVHGVANPRVKDG